MVPKPSRAARVALLRALIGDAGTFAGNHGRVAPFAGVVGALDVMDDETLTELEGLYRASEWLVGWDAMRGHLGLTAKQWENARPDQIIRRGHRVVFVRVSELEQWARARALLTAAGTRQVVYGRHAGTFRDPDLEGWSDIARAAGLTVAQAQRAATDYAPALATERDDSVRADEGLPVRYRHRAPPLAHSSEIDHWRMATTARADLADTLLRSDSVLLTALVIPGVDAERDAARERALWPIRRVWDLMTLLSRW